jgi:hypothetical protein
MPAARKTAQEKFLCHKDRQETFDTNVGTAQEVRKAAAWDKMRSGSSG